MCILCVKCGKFCLVIMTVIDAGGRDKFTELPLGNQDMVDAGRRDDIDTPLAISCTYSASACLLRKMPGRDW